MKRALMPILLVFGAIVILVITMYLYEQKWGLEGPFPSQHHHFDESGKQYEHDEHHHH